MARPAPRSRCAAHRLCRGLVLAACGLALSGSAAARLTLMHGFIDYTSALLWIQTEASGPVEVVWRVEDGAGESRRIVDAVAAEDNTVVVRLTGLKPGALVNYTVSGDRDSRAGSLRAQRHWNKPADAPEIAIAIGSCFYLADADPIWGGQKYGGGFEIFDAIAAKAPDAMVWMGDNLYYMAQDELDADAMAARHRRQRSLPALQKLLTATANVATWDDHDYGPNDADLSYVMKGTSLTLFRRYWANPSFGLPETPGVFGLVRVGDVDIFLLDDRYYRWANNAVDQPDKAMLGAAQLTWLKNALAHSTAPVKLVVNGSQMWNRTNRFEGWNRYPAEQKAFADWLLAQKVDGLVFLSGDRHFSTLLKVERPGAYPLIEFTSSPLTSSPWDPPPAGERQNPDLVPGTLMPRRQFGIVRVSGHGHDRHIALEAWDTQGELLWKHELRARDLRFARGKP